MAAASGPEPEGSAEDGGVPVTVAAAESMDDAEAADDTGAAGVAIEAVGVAGIWAFC